jgi:hypothetical protein
LIKKKVQKSKKEGLIKGPKKKKWCMILTWNAIWYHREVCLVYQSGVDEPRLSHLREVLFKSWVHDKL